LDFPPEINPLALESTSRIQGAVSNAKGAVFSGGIN
jgi:hypothetical protein